ASYGDRLADNVQRADRQRIRTHGRKADELAAGRGRRWEHARRRPADTIKRQAEPGLTDSRCRPFWDTGSGDDHAVTANRRRLGREEADSRNDQSLPAGEAGERRQDPVAELDVLHPWTHIENAADSFIADDGWKRGAQCIDAICEQ